MTNEQVTEMEDALRRAEVNIEKAMRLVCNEPLDDEHKRAWWAAMQDASAEIEKGIHDAYMFRPAEQ